MQKINKLQTSAVCPIFYSFTADPLSPLSSSSPPLWRRVGRRRLWRDCHTRAQVYFRHPIICWNDLAITPKTMVKKSEQYSTEEQRAPNRDSLHHLSNNETWLYRCCSSSTHIYSHAWTNERTHASTFVLSTSTSPSSPSLPPLKGREGRKKKKPCFITSSSNVDTHASTNAHTHTHYNKNGVVCSNKTKIMITSIARLTPYLSRQDRHSKMMAFTPSSWNTRDDR